MANITGRYEWVGKLAKVALAGMLVLLFLALLVTVVEGVLVINEPGREGQLALGERLAPWVLLFVGELVALICTFVALGVISMISSCELSSSNAASRLRRLETLLSEQEESTRILVDLAKLSDRAKSLVYRDGEIEAMREAVHHDLMKQDYDAAEELINSFEGQPGCARESARLRAVLAASRKGTLDEQIEAAIKHVQEKIGSRDWAQAKRQADRLTKLFPGRPMVSALSEQIQTARARHKRDLLQAYGQAVEKRDIDGGITLLKELDTYLTPQEAAALEESARGVFKARLLNYGVQFSICVTDKNWAKAVAVGEQIIEAYPNSRMAQEVNEKMDLLRTHAYAAVEAVKLQQSGSPAEAGAEA